MANILDDLDQITKLEVNMFKIEMRSFDIKELIVEVLESLELIASEKNITLKLHKDYNSKYVIGDRSKIAQVLINLISNSIFYGKENGSTLIRLFSMDNIITIEVSDDGPGIEQQHIPRLFERFYRVEKSRNRNEGGSGLGLAIVKHIIESHGQTISVRSTVGIGSTFSFSLDKSKSQTPSLYSSRGIQIK
jgi:two-component system phosphate regulon sensor histidine kinase PhoR